MKTKSEEKLSTFTIYTHNHGVVLPERSWIESDPTSLFHEEGVRSSVGRSNWLVICLIQSIQEALRHDVLGNSAPG